MKIKSILASAAACAIAVSAMAITAFAGEMPIQNGTESDGKYAYSVLDNLPQGRTASEVFGAKVDRKSVV